VLGEADLAIKNLKDWVKPQKASTPLVNLPGTSYIIREPFGVALIM